MATADHFPRALQGAFITVLCASVSTMDGAGAAGPALSESASLLNDYESIYVFLTDGTYVFRGGARTNVEAQWTKCPSGGAAGRAPGVIDIVTMIPRLIKEADSEDAYRKAAQLVSEEPCVAVLAHLNLLFRRAKQLGSLGIESHKRTNVPFFPS